MRNLVWCVDCQTVKGAMNVVGVTAMLVGIGLSQAAFGFGPTGSTDKGSCLDFVLPMTHSSPGCLHSGLCWVWTDSSGIQAWCCGV